MESLRKFLKSKKYKNLDVTTSLDIYKGTGKEILKKVSQSELKENVVEKEFDIFDDVLYVVTENEGEDWWIDFVIE